VPVLQIERHVRGEHKGARPFAGHHDGVVVSAGLLILVPQPKLVGDGLFAIAQNDQEPLASLGILMKRFGHGLGIVWDVIGLQPGHHVHQSVHRVFVGGNEGKTEKRKVLLKEDDKRKKMLEELKDLDVYVQIEGKITEVKPEKTVEIEKATVLGRIDGTGTLKESYGDLEFTIKVKKGDDEEDKTYELEENDKHAELKKALEKAEDKELKVTLKGKETKSGPSPRLEVESYEIVKDEPDDKKPEEKPDDSKSEE